MLNNNNLKNISMKIIIKIKLLSAIKVLRIILKSLKNSLMKKCFPEKI